MKRYTLLAPLVSLGLVLAACGGDDDTAAEQPVDTPDEADETAAAIRVPQPIVAVSESANGESSRSGAAVATASAEVATSDMMMAPFIAEFIVSDSLPALPDADTGFVFDADTAVTADDAVRLAAVFGVEGEPSRDGQVDGAWIVGSDDGSSSSVWLFDDAQGSWSYNAPWLDSALVEPCAVSIDSEGNESGGDCPAPEPLIGVPTAEEAEDRARATMADLGFDTNSLTFEAFADEWSANVTVDDRSADRPALRYWNFGYGAEGVLQWAGGSLTTPEPVGPYPLVDLDTAVERLRDQGGFGVPLPLLDGPMVEEGEAVTSGVVPAEEPPVAPDEAPAETLVLEEPFEPDPVVVTLVDVQADLWWVWDESGSVWLVPAYRFIDADGGWHTVPAVTDEFLMRSDQPDDGPIPVEPDGGIGDGAEPLPPPESLPPAPDDEPAEERPVEERPVDGPESALALLDEYVGLSIEEFTAEAKALGYSTRVAVQDGEALALTADFSETRVNVEVEGPRVVSLVSIG